MYRVLLVDDDPHILSTSEKFFCQKGYEVFCAGTAQDALDVLAHTEVTDPAIPATCTEPILTTAGAAERVCSKDETHKETATVPVLTDTAVWTPGTKPQEPRRPPCSSAISNWKSNVPKQSGRRQRVSACFSRLAETFKMALGTEPFLLYNTFATRTWKEDLRDEETGLWADAPASTGQDRPRQGGCGAGQGDGGPVPGKGLYIL